MAPARLVVALKALRQLGLSRVGLYALYHLGLRSSYFRWRTGERQRTTGRHPTTLFPGLFPLPDREQLKGVLGRDGRRRLLAEADEIAAGMFRPFGGEPAPLQLAFDGPLQHWTAYETRKATLPTPIPDSHDPTTDLKFIWEPARFGWAYTLGRAYHLTRKQAYAQTFWGHTETFLEANPPYLGPHWMNGQEVAVRLLALLWAFQVFEGAEASSPERRARLAAAIEAHAARIPPTLMYACAQNNNHLLTEAAALYVAGLALDRAVWRDTGWRWLNRALRGQLSSYGEYIQHSTNYHRVMLAAVLWVEAVREREWPALTRQALGRATHWLYSLLDPATGQVPNLGANDGALLLPLAACPYRDFRPAVQAAARAFLRFQLPPGPWDEAALWLGLASHPKAYESGLYMGDHLHGRVSWAYLRASSFRSRLGHMDQLHLDLWWRGLNVAQDAGTYLYNADPPWDNSLVASRVHNAVTVDGRDQMTRAGRFMTLDWFPAFSKRVIATEEDITGRVLAYHRGYRGVRHERTVTLWADEHWQVQDRLISQRAHHYRLHWLLQDWEWEVEEDRDASFVLRLRSPHGWIRLRLASSPGLPNNEGSISLIHAGELVFGHAVPLPFEGWVSPTYGQKAPALSLAWEMGLVQSVQLTTEFIFPDESASRSGPDRR